MKKTLKKNLVISFCTIVPIVMLYLLSYSLNYYTLIAPFCATVALIVDRPDSEFSRPQNIFFGYLINISAVVFFASFLDDHNLLGFIMVFLFGFFLMLHFNLFHPSASAVTIVEFFVGNNPEMMILYGFIASTLMCIFSYSYQKIHEKIIRL